MSFVKKWKAFWGPSVALAFDRDTLWTVGEPDVEPRRTATCVALGAKTRAVAAVGDAARALRDDVRAQWTFADYVRLGGLVDFDAAEVAFRHALRGWRKGRWSLTPRVVVATSGGDVQKRAITDAVTHAGAREIISIPRMMAAAIGGGLDILGAVSTVVYVDRDWWSMAVIGRSNFLASMESADAPEHLAVDRAWRERREGDGSARNFDTQFMALWREGVESNDGAMRWVRRMGEHYRSMMSTLSQADANAARKGVIQLTGPCAKMPGLRVTMEMCLSRAVTVPPRAEEAVILGCRSLLGEVDAVLSMCRRRP